MRAIAAHFIGFYIVDALMPAWAAEVDGELASVWYMGFMIVDMGAICIAAQRSTMVMLAMSCAWSGMLSLETYMLQDFLQGMDYAVQYLIDGSLLALFFAHAWDQAKKSRCFSFRRF